MSTIDASRSTEDLPSFDLACHYDDTEDPAEVTVFDPDSADVTTTWLTVDAESAVPLDRIA